MVKARRQWDDVSRLAHELGRENHVAQRMVSERKARGWGQSELARQLAAKGFPWLDQRAISAIESPRSDATKRRSIRVDEALALARTFDMPVLELLIPQRAMDDLAISRDLIDLPQRWSEAQKAVRSVYGGILRLAADTYGHDDWTQYLAQELEAARLLLADLKTATPDPMRRRSQIQQVEDAEDRVRFFELLISKRSEIQDV